MLSSPSVSATAGSVGVTAPVEIRPGRTRLAEWNAIYRGAPVALDPFARPDVEAGAVALAEILASPAPPRLDTQAPSIAELMERGGDRLPSPLVRLFVALKLGSLAQGMSGVRWDTLRGVDEFLSAGLSPAIPGEGIGDRLALAHLFAAITGTGEAVAGDKRLPAAKALSQASLHPLHLEAHERGALLSGTQLSAAAALAGLFEAERLHQSALVAAACTAMATSPPATILHPRARRLHRQPGQVEAASAFAALIGLGDIAQAANAAGPQECAGARTPFAAGACLDLLRQAGATLERAANAVTEDRLILWQSGELVAGAEDSSSVKRAADLVAVALRTIGELSYERIAVLRGVKEEAPESGAERRSPGARTDHFVTRLRDQAEALTDVRRLLPMTGTAALVLAIEFLEATRLYDAAGDRPPARLDDVFALVRETVSDAPDAEAFAIADLARIAERIGSGALVAAAGQPLPGLPPAKADRPAPLGAGPKHK
jgi:histidine ammonia-lyase